MITSEIRSLQGWVRDVLISSEYKTHKFEKGNNVTEVTERPIAVDTYNKYGQIENQYKNSFDIKV